MKIYENITKQATTRTQLIKNSEKTRKAVGTTKNKQGKQRTTRKMLASGSVAKEGQPPAAKNAHTARILCAYSPSLLFASGPPCMPHPYRCLQIIANPCKFLQSSYKYPYRCSQILANPYHPCESSYFLNAHTLCLPLGLGILANPYKSLRRGFSRSQGPPKKTLCAHGLRMGCAWKMWADARGVPS